MSFIEELSENAILRWLVPIGIGLAVTVITILLRNYIYRKVQKWSQKTQKKWDDILVRATRRVSLLWCLVLGVYVGIEIAVVPVSWESWIDDTVPKLFVAMGLYTGVVIAQVFIEWYRVEVAAKTASPLDDAIMAALKWVVPAVALVLGTFLILSMVGVDAPAFWNWIGAHGPDLALLVGIGLVLLLGGTALIPGVTERMVRRGRAEERPDERQKRVQTLSSVLVGAYQVIIIILFFVMILNGLGVNTTALVAATGVIGFAIGFGAQELVKDMVAGVFILSENQYRNGDVVRVSDTSGLITMGRVVEINLRRSLLRDLDGMVHTVPNGKIVVSSNFTREYSSANLNVSVAYRTDLNHAIAVINRVGKEMAEDPAWAPDLLTIPQVLRIDNLGDSGIEIKITADTKAMRQWDVMGQLRLRIKKAFDEEGIEIPWPHTKVYFGNPPELSAAKQGA